MFPRRSAAVLAAATVLFAATSPAALADDPSPGEATADKLTLKKLPAGLYGKGDPKYDGVWRQSMALLAQDAAGATPAVKAVGWLAGQQCADGSFTAYRADTGAPCDAKRTPADTNATAIAVQALSAAGGRGATVRKALAWLTSVQNKDGGWGYSPSLRRGDPHGSPTDANSLSVVIGAYAAAGERPEKIRKGDKSPYDALTALQLGCDAKAAERGAFAYQPDTKGKSGKSVELTANDDATAAAVLAASGSGLSAEPPRKDDKPGPITCDKGDATAEQHRGPGGAADSGAAYLASVLKKHGRHLRSVTPGAKGTPDYANTADAVIALGAAGHRSEARQSLDWLAGHLGSWNKAADDPAAIGAVMLAVHATGGDPATLHGVKLLNRLDATGPKPARMPDKATDAGSPSEAGAGAGGVNGTVLTWSLVGAGLAAGAGVGFQLSRRRKRREL